MMPLGPKARPPLWEMVLWCQWGDGEKNRFQCSYNFPLATPSIACIITSLTNTTHKGNEMTNDFFDNFEFSVRQAKGRGSASGSNAAVRITVNRVGRPSTGTSLRISISASTIDKMRARAGDRFAIGVSADKTQYALVPNADGYALQLPSKADPKSARHVLSAANTLGLQYGESEDFENCDVTYRNGGIILTRGR